MIGRLPLLLVLFVVPALAAGQSPPAARLEPREFADAESARSAIIYVARRGWHVDIGFAAADLEPPLDSLAAEFPGVRYLFFGFGDRQYLLAKKHNAPVLLAALWPGHGMLLATGLTASPSEAFGAPQVAMLGVTPQQLRDAQAFVWQSLVRHAGTKPSARGPYDGSLYFAAAPKYSALHTCNTWAAQALESAALPVHSGGVVFAGQLWVQVRRVMRKQTTLSAPIQQGGFDPSSQITVVPEF